LKSTIAPTVGEFGWIEENSTRSLRNRWKWRQRNPFQERFLARRSIHIMKATGTMTITTNMAVVMAINENPGLVIFLTKSSLSQVDDERSCVEGGSTVSMDGTPDGLSHQMLAILEKADGNGIALGSIIATLSRSSHAVLIVFLSFPLCLPVGIPVLTTTLGLTLGLVGFLMAIGREIWIPKSIAAKVIPYKRLSYFIERLLRASKRMERWFHPRMLFFAINGKMMRIHGLFIMLMGLTASVPLPLPFNNLVAALPILLLGLSLLEWDGFLAIVSYLASIPCFIYYGTLIYFSHAGFERLMGF
jgi:hypothetical protein